MTSRILQEDSSLILTQANEPLINEDFIGANGFSTGSPVIQTTAIAQDHTTNVISIVTGQPLLSTTVITQVHDLSPTDVTSGQPVVSASSIDQVHDLSSISIVTGSVVVLPTAFTQDHDLSASSVVTEPAVVPTLNLVEGEVNTAEPIVTGVPEVDTIAIAQNNSFGADDILTGRPDVEDATDPNVIYEQAVQQMFGGWPKRLYEHTDLAISRGHSAGYRHLYKFGYNPDVNGTEETVWAEGGNYLWLPSAVTMFVSSSSVNDTSGGTGANTILIQGLDEDYNEIEETVALNGQTQVATQLSYLRVYRSYVTLAGSAGTSGGTVYIAASGSASGVPTGAVYASLALGNQTQIAAYTVPAGYTLYLDEINFTAALSTANKRVNASFHTREFGSNVFRTRFINVLQSSQLKQLFKYPQPFAEKTDMECRVYTDATNNPIAASFQGVLIKNGP
tara:strand:- start:505 stop:1854 length:1350 start_codon:yes stop_codon:yes gene_type:complete